jgi:hypothetical protein
MERGYPAGPVSGYAKPETSASKDYLSSEKKFGRGINEKIYDAPLGHDIDLELSQLPKTGVEYPFLKHRPVFIPDHDEFEACVPPVSPLLVEDYKRRLEERATNPKYTDKVVFDSIEPSPYYNSKEDKVPYISERDHVTVTRTDLDTKPGTYADLTQQKFLEKVPTYCRAHYYSHLNPYYRVRDDRDETLVFESRFESGNLRRAVQVADYEYDLYLKPDYNTNSYTQWFYFRVTNTRKDRTYRFNIKNLQKSDSLYNYGMLPLVYSRKEAERVSNGWHREAENVCYYQNPHSQKKNKGNFNYILSFDLSFRYDNDEVYIAHCYPYTYSDLKLFVNSVCTTQNRDRIRKTSMCKTLAGNDCEMLIITNFYSREEDIAD